jgi:hypothetical protein
MLLTILIITCAAAIGLCGGYIGYHWGYGDSRRLWIWQCDALADQIKIYQEVTHTPMINGNSVLAVLNQVRGHAVYSTFEADDPFADSPFNAEVIKPGDPGYDILEQARRDGFAEGEL